MAYGQFFTTKTTNEVQRIKAEKLIAVSSFTTHRLLYKLLLQLLYPLSQTPFGLVILVVLVKS